MRVRGRGGGERGGGGGGGEAKLKNQHGKSVGLMGGIGGVT